MNTKRVKVDLQLCRICLGTGRMYDMRRYKLSEPYLILTGLKISQKDGLPEHTCHMCSTMLVKCMMFREKCHKTVKYLKDVINNQITETQNVKSQYTVNKVLGISYTIQQDTNYIPNRCHVIKHEYDNDYNGGEINIDYHEVEIKHDIQINNDYHKIGISNDCDTKSDYEIEKENTFVDIKTEAIVGKTLVNEDAENCKKRKNIETKIPRKRQAIVRNLKIKKEQIKPNKHILKSKVTKPPGMSTEEGRQMLAKKYGLKIEVMKEEEERRKDLQKRNIDIKDGAKCGLCYKLYENEELLKKHTMKEHDMSKPQCCKYCGYRTDTKRSLHSHTSRNHVFKFTCLTCGLMMRNTSVLAEHHRTHSGQTITCRVCGTICRNTKRYRLHLRKVHPSELKWCNICGEVFISLVNHYTASHPEDLKPDLKCKHCNAYFSTPEALATHTNKHTDMQTKLLESDKPCFYCGQSFTNEQNLREHFGTKHKEHQFIPKKRPSQKKKPGERKKTCAIANGAHRHGLPHANTSGRIASRVSTVREEV